MQPDFTCFGDVVAIGNTDTAVPTVAHLLLEFGQLAREVAHQLHGGLQLLLQVPDLVLLALAVHAHQRHGAHPREPVQVVLLRNIKCIS